MNIEQNLIKGSSAETKNNESWIEVKHLPDLDIMINKTASNQDTIQQILFALESQELDVNNRLSFDVYLSKQRIFVKKKSSVFVQMLQRVKDGEDGSSLGYDKETVYAFNSLMNELKLSASIKRLIESQEAHTIAVNYGFESISFCEPLVGVINKKIVSVYDISVCRRKDPYITGACFRDGNWLNRR